MPSLLRGTIAAEHPTDAPHDERPRAQLDTLPMEVHDSEPTNFQSTPGPARDARTTWPTAAARQGTANATPTGTPIVSAEVAFRALWYVGVDPEAEKTWMTAINDLNLPPDVRSDLIEDLNDEGYTDNSNPTKADLPLILARLELIERISAHAIDEVNAKAFEEAYKDLLELYVRLGGAPRKK